MTKLVEKIVTLGDQVEMGDGFVRLTRFNGKLNAELVSGKNQVLGLSEIDRLDGNVQLTSSAIAEAVHAATISKRVGNGFLEEIGSQMRVG